MPWYVSFVDKHGQTMANPCGEKHWTTQGTMFTSKTWRQIAVWQTKPNESMSFSTTWINQWFNDALWRKAAVPLWFFHPFNLVPLLVNGFQPFVSQSIRGETIFIGETLGNWVLPIRRLCAKPFLYRVLTSHAPMTSGKPGKRSSIASGFFQLE